MTGAIGTTLVLGAGQGYIDTLSAASLASDRVVATDADEDAPGKHVVDQFEPVDITAIEETEDVARQYDVDAVVPVNDFGVRTAAVVSDRLGLPGLAPEVAEVCTDKARMRDAWEEAGLSQPDYTVVRTLSEARDVFESWSYPLVVKPANSTGGGSRGVRVLDEPDESEAAFTFAQEAYEDDRVLIESCAVGTEHTVEAIVDGGEPHVLAVSDREILPPPYRVDKAQIYPSASDAVDSLRDRAVEAIRALDIDLGAVHLEATVTDDGIELIELGARGGGGAIMEPIVRATSGVEYVAEVVRLHAGVEPKSVEPEHSEGVTYRYLTPTGGRLTSYQGAQAVAAWEGVLDVQIWAEAGDDLPEQIRVGSDRSGAIVTHRPDREAAYALAERAEDAITFETEPPRNDA